MDANIQDLEKAFQEIARGLSKIFNAIMKVWGSVKTVIKNSEEWIERYFKRMQQIEDMRASWLLIRDNRKSSQVLLNKPRNLVRKVIR